MVTGMLRRGATPKRCTCQEAIPKGNDRLPTIHFQGRNVSFSTLQNSHFSKPHTIFYPTFSLPRSLLLRHGTLFQWQPATWRLEKMCPSGRRGSIELILSWNSWPTTLTAARWYQIANHQPIFWGGSNLMQWMLLVILMDFPLIGPLFGLGI